MTNEAISLKIGRVLLLEHLEIMPLLKTCIRTSSVISAMFLLLANRDIHDCYRKRRLEGLLRLLGRWEDTANSTQIK